MAFSHSERTLLAVEVLADAPGGVGVGGGVGLGAMAAALGVPKSGAHRLMADLVRMGFAAQDPGGAYHLTPRLVALAFRHLGRLGVVDACQPVLDDLAARSGELVRLSVTAADRQVWVAKAQGARGGLIFDPQMGAAAHLASMATGQAWLASMSDEAALRLVMAQGLRAEGAGPGAPGDVPALLAALARARAAGFAAVTEASAPGMSALAAVVRHPVSAVALGTVSIGGPSVRLTPARIETLAPALLAAASDLSDRVAGSGYFTPGLAQGARADM